MSTAILSDPRLFVILFRIDSDLAEKARADRCSCGGRLDTADYPRKPRAPGLGPEYRKRHSFCCAVCRRRTTPPSVRFFARRVYAFIHMLDSDDEQKRMEAAIVFLGELSISYNFRHVGIPTVPRSNGVNPFRFSY